jgi:predicted RNA-binding protein with PIN domain
MRPALPDGLLVPLLEVAAETLKGLNPADLPATGRRLATFDRRGLATPAARTQLRRLLEADETFRDEVLTRFARRDDVAALAGSWNRAEAARAVADAVEQGGLPLLASFLWTQEPPGWEFALGVALAAFQWEQAEEERAGEFERLERKVAEAVEAQRRAEDARDRAEEKLARLVEEQRAARRDRKGTGTGTGTAEPPAAQRRAAEQEAARREAERRLAEAEARAEREATRARGAEERERALRADLAAVAARTASGPDPTALAEAAEAATELAARLRKLSREVEPPDVQGPREAARPAAAPLPRRAPVHVPPGMRGDEPEAAEAMVRTPGVTVIVDGYNVTMSAWPDATKAVQRERLTDAVAELHLRARCRVVVVWDGADVPAARSPSRKGVTVLFSPAGVEADDVVIEQVRRQARSVPVLVVSSDGAVRARAEMNGAQVLSSRLFMGVLRR